jgi:hypothetical protein
LFVPPRSRAAVALGLALCLLVLGAVAVAHGHDEKGAGPCDCALCGWLGHAAPKVDVIVAVLHTPSVAGAVELRSPTPHARAPGCPVSPRGPPLA